MFQGHSRGSPARKFKVGLVLAHQNLEQLSERLRATIMTSTSIKLAVGLSARDAAVLALVATIVGIFSCVRAHAGPCDEPSTPCVITDVQGLEDINKDLLGYYELGNNIDASGYNFTPIGDRLPFGDISGLPFTGELNGNEHIVRNLTIDDGGLFSNLGGTIKNIGLTNLSVGATSFGVAGGLANVNSLGGTIINSYVSGSVTNPGHDALAFLGGLVGGNAGTILQSYSTGTVSSGGNTGGLVGGQSGSGVILQSFSNANVSGAVGVGGLAGINSGTIKQAYFTGTAVGGGRDFLGSVFPSTGGIAGYQSGTLDQVYAAGLVQGGTFSTAGGLVGTDGGGQAVNSYWDVQATQQNFSGLAIGGLGLTTAQLQSGMLPAGFDPAVWTATPGQYPKLIGVGGQVFNSPPINDPATKPAPVIGYNLYRIVGVDFERQSP